MGNPAADFYGGSREGSSLYTDCVVELDADTGRLKWHSRVIPHDVWDCDSAYEFVLIDRLLNGAPSFEVSAVSHARWRHLET